MLKYVWYAVWVIAGDTTMLIGLHMNLNERIKHRTLKYLPMLLLSIAYFIFAVIFTTENTMLRVCFVISYFAYAIIAFKEKLTKTLMVAAILSVISLVVDLIVEIPVYILHGKIVTPSETTLEYIIISIIFALVYMIAIIEYTRFNRRNEIIIDKTALLFFLMPVSNMMLILAIVSEFNSPAFWTPLRAALLCLGMGVMLISIYLLYKAMRENYKAKQTQIRLAQLEYDHKLSESYFENVTQSAHMLMKYKHDFNNMITTALHMISSEDGETKSEGVRLLEQIRDKNKATAIPVYCKNAVVNTILFDKSARAEAEGVDFTFEVDLPERLDMELTDLCSVFTNLIDNGLHSAEVSEDNRLELKAWCDMDYLFVRTKNYPDEDTPLPETKKSFDIKNISSHGYGLSIIEDMAQKYGGSFEIKQQSGSVEMLCCVGIAESSKA